MKRTVNEVKNVLHIKYNKKAFDVGTANLSLWSSFALTLLWPY